MAVVSYDEFRQKLEGAEREMTTVTTELPLTPEDVDRLQLLFVARVMQLIGDFDFRMATSTEHEGDVEAARAVQARILGLCEEITTRIGKQVAQAISWAIQRVVMAPDDAPSGSGS